MNEFKNCRNIIWDFDGVIMDSMPIRERGFVETLAGYPSSQVSKLVGYHRANGGLSRYAKFRYFFEEIRAEKVSEKRIQQCADLFSQIMLNHLIDPNLLIGETVDFIRANYKKYNFHIASGSDEKELRRICGELELTPYFISIKGSPIPKVELVRSIIEGSGYRLKETCLIGDSINDLEAAKANHIDFFGYNNPTLKQVSSNYISMF